MQISNGVGLESSVLEVFAAVTRYPVDILYPEASLEEELGIDSVKLGEVFSVLRERFRLPEKLDLPREQLKTISGVTEALGRFLVRNGSVPQSPLPARQSAMPEKEVLTVFSEVGHRRIDGFADLNRQVIDIFAEVTRYPIEILAPDANLEEDLGVDSVKLGEVFSVLRERFHLPERLDVPRDQLKTLAGVTSALQKYLTGDRDANGDRKGGIVQNAGFEAEPVGVREALTQKAANGQAQKFDRSNGSNGFGATEEEVLQVFAEVTKYPKEILDPGAALEEDLGVDSVKLGEVFSVLRERYKLPAELNLARENLKTIRGVTEALVSYLSAQSAPISASREIRVAWPNGVSEPGGQGVTSDRSARSFALLKPELKPFTGKIAFISGSGRGIGKEIAVYLADLGATVIVNSFHSRQRGEEAAAEIKAVGGEAIHLWGSMANPTHVNEMFDQIEQRFGAIDFFVSSASNGMLARLEDITVQDWEKAFRTNIIGLHQGAMGSARLMRKRGGGKIITMSSPAAHGYVDYFGCMGAVKAAVESLTRSLAIELAPDNIQVNCVSPGPVYGELLNKWPESERLIKQWEGNTAYKRLCKAEDVSHFVAYLLSDSVKLFTGSILVMDGGISAQGW
jgi:enoyl-[acyl-carrier protein] reductase III